MKQLIYLILLVFVSTSVQAQVYEEISYEDLVQKLNQKKTTIQKTTTTTNPLDDIYFHAGISLITSLNSMILNDKHSTRQLNGFQLSFGVDLFSEYWSAEGALRNFGVAHSGTETRSLRETDLKVVYKNKPTEKFGYHLASGVGTRYLKLSDPYAGLDVNDSTPTLFFIGGVDGYLNKYASLGLELGYRTAMVSNTADKSAIDLSVLLNTAF